MKNSPGSAPATDAPAQGPRLPAQVGLAALLLAVLFLISRYNYLLFHSLAELFSIAVAWSVFMLVWNTRRLVGNDALVLLGTAYLFVGFLDLLHTLAYKGMGVFPGHYGADLSTQLWIAARYLESVSMLVFSLCLGCTIRPRRVIAVYSGAVLLILASLFIWPVFPACYVENSGLTPFKKVSEYLICCILLAAALQIRRNRAAFSRPVHLLILSAILATIAGELAFTFYVSVYGVSNLVGHFLKILSFFLIYLALIRSGLSQPCAVLFGELAASNARWKAFSDHFNGAATMLDDDGRYLSVNREGAAILNEDPADVTGKRFRDLLPANIAARFQWRLETLEESRRMLQTLVGNLPGIAFRCRNDRDWTMVYLSEGCRATTGYPPSDLLHNQKLSYNQLILPEDRERVWQSVQNALDARKPYEMEYRIRHADGGLRWVMERGTGVWSQSGELLAIEGFVTDISERMESIKLIGEQKHLLQSILDGLPDVIGLHHPDHTIISYNRAGYSLFGKPPEAVDGKKCYELLGRECPCEPCVLQAALASGEKESIEAFFPRFGRWFQATAIPIHDDDGRPSLIVEQFHDITGRRQREAELRRLDSAIAQAAEAVLITDAEGVIRYVNPAFQRITGYTREEAVGQNPRILKSDRHDPGFYRAFWQTIKAGHIWSGRFINRKQDGALYTQEGTVSPVMSEAGEIVNFVAVMRDITTELRNEEQFRQAQKMEAIGALAGGIAHDFNNILFPVMGYAEMLRDDLGAESESAADLDEIISGINRARELVQQILTFSRQREEARTTIRVQAILKEVTKLSRATLPSTIRIETEVDPDCPPVLADPTQIHQVLMNLVTNALHAMEAGGGRLSLTLHPRTVSRADAAGLGITPGPHVRLQVTDTGSGMEKAVMERIFDPYFTTKAEGKGTGLGLSVVHGIVRNFSGAISVESTPGIGTRFEILLPAVHQETAGSVKPDRAAPVAGGGERILLVDDEHPIIQMVTRLLERLGYRVTGCTSSTEALTLFRNRPDDFDLVLTDTTMPEITGDRLAREIKTVDPAMPVIICTGFSEVMDEERARDLGIDAFVNKPILGRDIADMLRTLLDARRTGAPASAASAVAENDNPSPGARPEPDDTP